MTDDVDRLEGRVKQLENEIKTIKSEQKERELRQLRWGVQALGVIVIGMGGWIWTQVGHLFDLGSK